MNIFAKFKTMLAGSTAQPIVAAVTAVAGNELDRAVLAAKTTEIGAEAIKAVQAAEAAAVPGTTGATKKAQAITAVVPIVVLHISKTGLAATLADVETFAGLVIESVLTDLKTTGVKAIANAVLQLAVGAVTAAA